MNPMLRDITLKPVCDLCGVHLRGRADAKPLEIFAIQYNFEKAVTKYLLGWTNRFEDYMEYANENGESTINKYLAQAGSLNER